MHIMYNLYVNSHFKITLSKDQYTVKAQEHLFPTWLCCHVTVCPCTNGGHHGGCHLASVTRCKILKAVVKPFIHVQLTRAGLACRKGSLKCKQAMALQLGHSLLAAWPGIPKLHLFIAAFLPFLSSFPQWHSTISRFISQCLHQKPNVAIGLNKYNGSGYYTGIHSHNSSHVTELSKRQFTQNMACFCCGVVFLTVVYCVMKRN